MPGNACALGGQGAGRAGNGWVAAEQGGRWDHEAHHVAGMARGLQSERAGRAAGFKAGALNSFAGRFVPAI
jgi:hypothetical protein